jgi:hypothetical protein
MPEPEIIPSVDEVSRMTPEEALNAIAAIQDDRSPDSPFWDTTSARYEGAAAYKAALYKRAYPDETPVLVVDTKGEEAAPVDVSNLPAVPEGHAWSPALVSSFREAAGELGLSASEQSGFLALYSRCLQEGAPEPEAALETLEARHGRERARKMIRAAQLIAKRVALSLRLHLDETGLGDHPALIEYLAGIGKRHGVGDAEAKIAAIRADKNHPWHKGDPAALDEMRELYKRVHGTRPVVTIR